MIVKGSPHSCRVPLFPRAEAGRTEREEKGTFPVLRGTKSQLSACGVSHHTLTSLHAPSSATGLKSQPGPPENYRSRLWATGSPLSGSREGSVELFLVALMRVKNAPLPV